MDQNTLFYKKYILYKKKYIELNNQIGSGKKKKISNKKTSINVSEPWFTLIKLGLKTIEGRKNKGIFKDMKIGEIIEWTNNEFTTRCVLTKIIKKTKYNTFKEYLETEGLDKCLPGIDNIKDGLSIYFKYFTEKDEKEFGVLALELELI